jgi:hypothetical protein
MKKGSPEGYNAETGFREPAQKPKSGEPNDYQTHIGFDVHKKTINYCVKGADGNILEEGILRALPIVLREWAGKRQEPWHGAMEATLFSGWVYDALKPFASALEIGNPSMMKAISAAKKKNDQLDARKIADVVRCNLLPACYVAPLEMRELRRLLR